MLSLVAAVMPSDASSQDHRISTWMQSGFGGGFDPQSFAVQCLLSPSLCHLVALYFWSVNVVVHFFSAFLD